MKSGMNYQCTCYHNFRPFQAIPSLTRSGFTFSQDLEALTFVSKMRGRLLRDSSTIGAELEVSLQW